MHFGGQLSITPFPSDTPSVNAMFGLANGRYNNEYFSIHDLGTSVINPLQNVVPLDVERFFGTLVLNFLAINGPYLNNDDTWDTSPVNECKQLLIDNYENFARYELHIFIDNDSPNINEDTEDGVVTTDGLLAALATELADYGVTYHGRLDATAVQSLMEETITAFYGEINAPIPS